MIETREATQDDRPLIFATWLRAYRHGSHFPRHIPERAYFAAHHNVVEALLDRSTVRVAHPTGDPDVILGWSVVETLPVDETVTAPQVIHFVYIKPAFRRSGIARLLLDDAIDNSADGVPTWYSHETFALRVPGIAARIAGWAFNPYLALQYAANRSKTDAND